MSRDIVTVQDRLDWRLQQAQESLDFWREREREDPDHPDIDDIIDFCERIVESNIVPERCWVTGTRYAEIEYDR